MKRQSPIGSALLAFAFGGSSLAAESPRTVVIHAAQLFDGKSDRLVSNQVIVIQGDRIAEVGPAHSRPATMEVGQLEMHSALRLRLRLCAGEGAGSGRPRCRAAAVTARRKVAGRSETIAGGSEELNNSTLPIGPGGG
jgi:hypothetical protein